MESITLINRKSKLLSFRSLVLGLDAVLMLVAFAGIGIAHIFKSDYFIKRSGIRRGGEMLTESNRAGFQIAGAIFAAVVIYLLYAFLRH